jgi:hypothetical protein
MNNDNDTVQAKIAEVFSRGLSTDALITDLAEAEIALVNKNKTIDDLRNTKYAIELNFKQYKEEIIRVLMEQDLGQYTLETILDELGLEKPVLSWRVSFDIEIEYGTDIDNIVGDIETMSSRIEGLVSIDHNDSEEF